MAEGPSCPNCRTPMEPGTIGAESFVGQAKWYKARSTLALGGEKVGEYATDGMTWIGGFRCVKCRLLLLHY